MEIEFSYNYATLYEYDSFGNVTKQALSLGDMPTVANSPIVERPYGVESSDDGVFWVTSQTRYNAESEPLISMRKQPISSYLQHRKTNGGCFKSAGRKALAF